MTTDRFASPAPERAAPLVITKLLAPPVRPGLVPRPHLVARLNALRDTAVTVLSAPAGFGKTTLLAAWLREAAGAAPAGDAPRCAWLSLEAADSEPARFWAYVLAALRRAVPELPAGLDAPLRATPPRTDALVPGLANALADVPGEVVLILDDYHTVADLAVHRSLADLIDHRPPGLRLVIAGRADPSLPLARLRARGLLGELRAADLRFSSAESAAFLSRTMGLELGDAVVTDLDSAAEGWPAGLQLAALWLRDHPSADGLAPLAEGDRYLAAFLAEEVIGRQPPEIQRFLLDTAILDRWCPELCDYLLAEARHQEEGGEPVIARPAHAIIDEIERRNLFVVALDAAGRWFRYHTLFADALRRELARRRGPAAVARLHRRAAAWFSAASAEEPGLLEMALRHAAAEASLAAHAGLLRTYREAAPPDRDAAYEPLSGREQRVLRLIAAGCSNREIASALVVSVNTVKTHIRRIYQKLQVSSRVSAVERARGLGILR